MTVKTCYVCSSQSIKQEHDRVRDREDLRVMRCESCHLVFLDRFDHIQEDFYEKSGMYENTPPDPKSLAVEEQADIKRRVAALKDAVQGKTYLDFGCGSGHVVHELSKYAAVAKAVEPDRTMREYVKGQLGIEAFKSVDEITGKYDVISLFHVLEHIPDPRSVLRSLARFLNPEGMIYVEVPSADDALLKLYQSEAFKNFTYWSCHLFLFNPSNLRTLVGQAGLETEIVEQVQRYPLANHLYWLARKAPGGHKHWSFLRSAVLEDAYARILGSLGVCDTLVARVRFSCKKL